ncbi:MAG: hypothetical protein K1Y36_20680 [Blastocatellia bacterium]|nr:hypothetical protein [Blastocatellia bacterium]
MRSTLRKYSTRLIWLQLLALAGYVFLPLGQNVTTHAAHTIQEPAPVSVPPLTLRRDVNTYSNTTAITIPDEGPASLYPSVITVPPIPGTVTKVTCTINNLTHDYIEDVDILLVGPQGQKIQLMGDIGGGVSGAVGLNSFVCTFDDTGTPLPITAVPIPDGTYRPTNQNPDPFGDDIFQAPAPAGPYATALSVFNNVDPTGDWKLFVRDDAAGQGGTIAFGWSLTITTEIISPTVTQFYPVAATTGKTIRVFGTNFVPGSTQVLFGGTRQIAGTVTNVTPTTIDVTVPASSSGAGNINGYLTVRVAGTPDATTQFLQQNAPDPSNSNAVFPEFVLWGDATGDGTFQANDVALSRAYLQFQATPSARQMLAVDVVPANANTSRGNGQLTTTDFSFLRAVSFGQASF